MFKNSKENKFANQFDKISYFFLIENLYKFDSPFKFEFIPNVLEVTWKLL